MSVLDDLEQVAKAWAEGGKLTGRFVEAPVRALREVVGDASKT